MSIVGGRSWVKHKSGPKAVERAVMIAAIEAAYRAIIERKMNKPAWKLYNRMTDGELPPNMSDDMIMSLTGNDCNDTAWVAHKSSQEAVSRDVMIAAVERAHGEVVEKRRVLAEKEAEKARAKAHLNRQQLISCESKRDQTKILATLPSLTLTLK